MPDMGMPSLHQLRVFLTVVETGSFAAAGRRLRRATSAVSYTIANLETQLGIALFDRERTRKHDSRLITGKKTADPAARAGGRLVRWGTGCGSWRHYTRGRPESTIMVLTRERHTSFPAGGRAVRGKVL